jgi:hypothetical protein
VHKRLGHLQNITSPSSSSISGETSSLQRLVIESRNAYLAQNSSNFSQEFLMKEIYSFDDFVENQNLDILEYWELKRIMFPNLYKVVNTILSVPVTQVSVERLFSALKLILNDQRTSMLDEKLDNVLLIKLNFDIIDNILLNQ